MMAAGDDYLKVNAMRTEPLIAFLYYVNYIISKNKLNKK